MSKALPEEEHVVIIGPGSVLAEARIKQGFSIDEVANRLNFRAILVQNIESDIFDESISDTFNRGYLKNYAKLVHVSISEVIELYENLNIAKENQTKMQSFSNGTMKEAQNSMLMWITYLILTIFIGLTVMWWLQDNNEVSHTSDISIVVIENDVTTQELPTEIELNTSISQIDNKQTEVNNVTDEAIKVPLESTFVTEIIPDKVEEDKILESTDLLESNTPELAPMTQVVFSFSGDCWVNIHDALGERVAWGVKKAGYVMTINAQPPLKITIGRPELVKIDFGGENIDMSVYPEGHVAKLTLPLLPQS
jgi:cytoskeleton protein RodZ